MIHYQVHDPHVAALHHYPGPTVGLVRECYSSIGGRRTGGLERSLAMFLFFVIPAVSFLFACTFAFTIT